MSRYVSDSDLRGLVGSRHRKPRAAVGFRAKLTSHGNIEGSMLEAHLTICFWRIFIAQF